MSKTRSTESRQKLGVASFTVSGRIIRQLGRDSIASSVGAIVEIVKNSYDADAERVYITFKNLHSESPTIEIVDDGDGMDRTTLVERWMHIGDSQKLQLGKSRTKGRVLTGEKGMGRLGLDRLAQNASLQSFVANNDSGVEITIDWSMYEDQTSNIGAIKHPIFSIPKTKEDLLPPKRRNQPRKGTRLTLTKLRDTWASRRGEQWNYDFIKTLRRELSLLVSPLSGVKDFEIFVQADAGGPEINGPVTADEIIKGAEWKVTANLTADGMITFTVFSERFSVDQHVSHPWASFFEGKPLCGPLRFEMYFFPRNKSGNIGIESGGINKFLDENQGIRIYRDGFRVRPYGAPDGEGDWLNLSFRRQGRNQTVYDSKWKVGYKQIIGALFIGRLENPMLIDQTNREGLVEGTPYYDARRFSLRAIEHFEQERSRHERNLRTRQLQQEHQEHQEPAEGSKPDTLESIANKTEQLDSTATEAIRKIETEVETLLSMAGDTSVDWQTKRSTIEVLFADAKQTQEEAKNVHQLLLAASDAQRSEFEKQKNTLANLASLGILAATFGHETIGATNSVITNAEMLQLHLADLFFTNPDLKERAERAAAVVVRESRKIDTFARFALKNVGRDKRTRSKIHLDKIAQDVLLAFDETFKSRNIAVTRTYDSVPPIFGFRIDWESVIVNFITNSIWALEDTPAEKRAISLSMMRDGDKISFRFSDSGRGIEPGSEERIFEPTVSTKRNLKGDVVGTGMGLAIVKSFVEAHAGSIVAQNSVSGGAEFHTLLPVQKPDSRGTRAGVEDDE